MQEITLKLTLEEVNTILTALGTQPYTDVYQLVNKIQAEGSSQLQNTENGQETA